MNRLTLITFLLILGCCFCQFKCFFGSDKKIVTVTSTQGQERDITISMYDTVDDVNRILGAAFSSPILPKDFQQNFDSIESLLCANTETIKFLQTTQKLKVFRELQIGDCATTGNVEGSESKCFKSKVLVDSGADVSGIPWTRDLENFLSTTCLGAVIDNYSFSGMSGVKTKAFCCIDANMRIETLECDGSFNHTFVASPFYPPPSLCLWNATTAVLGYDYMAYRGVKVDASARSLSQRSLSDTLIISRQNGSSANMGQINGEGVFAEVEIGSEDNVCENDENHEEHGNIHVVNGAGLYAEIRLG
eukprot:TRINITY_DN530_c0_g4_i1.p1 TRINITY_DN530_c0_g4~~TRINITY_DN530_c0_g4_i1.p1  ORF type:complete len:305 (-),score=81.55 TRINITY_DN530_c0_g4_i1:274-1188(-)